MSEECNGECDSCVDKFNCPDSGYNENDPEDGMLWIDYDIK